MAKYITYGDLFQYGYTGTALSLLASELFTTDWLNWSPSVLKAEVWKETGKHLPDMASDKLQAISVLQTTDSFESQLEAFVAVCRSLNSLPIQDKSFTPADLDSLIIGCTEAGLHIGKLEKPNIDIKVYTGVVLEDHGVYFPPAVLSFAEYPTDVEKKTSAVQSRGEYADKNFWITQKDKRNNLEHDGLDHIQRILDEVDSLPVSVEKEEMDRIRESVSSLKET